MSTDVKWFELLRAYYGKALSGQEVDTWIKLLREPDAVTDITEAELCEVIRWKRKQRESGETERQERPTLERLIWWIRMYRKQRREKLRPANERETSDCGLCEGRGWISHWDSLGTQPTQEELLHTPPVAVPCLCGEGDTTRNMAYDFEHHADLRERAEKGRQQLSHIRAGGLVA